MTPWRSAICCGMILALACTGRAQQMSSSALIGQALDKQVDSLTAQGGLLDVMKDIENQTGVRIEASQAVYDALPWGPDTNISLNVKNTTLRQIIDGMASHLGLIETLGDEAVVLEPSPALRRLGRRATLDEIQLLDLLASTPFPSPGSDQTTSQLLSAVDQALTKSQSSFAVENQSLSAEETAHILSIPRNATLMTALNLLSDQTDATWYPWGHSLVVVPKVEAVRMLLGKRVTLRYHDVPLGQVLVELAEQSGTTFQMTPAVLQQVPAQYAKVTLTLDDATIDQALQSISGATGLKFTPQPDGIAVTFAGPTTQPAQ